MKVKALRLSSLELQSSHKVNHLSKECAGRTRREAATAALHCLVLAFPTAKWNLCSYEPD